MNANEIDVLARDNKPLPGEAELHEVGLYHLLFNIYRSFDRKEITTELAKKSKSDAISDFDDYEQMIKCYVEDNRRASAIGRIMSEANKNGCPICRKIAQIYDGRLRE